MRKNWQEWAACRGVDAELFHPTRGDRATIEDKTQQAISMCSGCPVRFQCLDQAMFEAQGVWGGWPAEIRAIVRRRGHPCPGCGKGLPPIKWDRLFCSDDCLSAAEGTDLGFTLDRMYRDAAKWNKDRRKALGGDDEDEGPVQLALMA